MVRMASELGRRHGQQTVFNGSRRGSRRQSGAVGDPEEVCVNRNGLRAEGGIEYDVRALAPYARERFERRAIGRHFASVAIKQLLRGGEDVPGLAVEQADGTDKVFEPRGTQHHHGAGIGRRTEELRGGGVDAAISGLRREYDRHQQLVRRRIHQFSARLRVARP